VLAKDFLEQRYELTFAIPVVTLYAASSRHGHRGRLNFGPKVYLIILARQSLGANGGFSLLIDALSSDFVSQKSYRAFLTATQPEGRLFGL
jgi:hypothetical protein